ncbi:MAG: MFS transporter [SAR202 cluster bacterium]|nr:MFS transporter [SAR202 cluster bacterium]
MTTDPSREPSASDAKSETGEPSPSADMDHQQDVVAAAGTPPAPASSRGESSGDGPIKFPAARDAAPEVSVFTLRHTFSSLGVTDFRRMWLSLLFISGAQNMQHVARSYLVYELTGSGKLLALVGAGAAMPMLGLGLFGGVLADHLDRKRLIQASQVVVVGIGLYLGISVWNGSISWGLLLASALLQGVMMSFLVPARQSLIPQIVGQARLNNAMALSSAGGSVFTLATPVVAGVMYAVTGPEWVFFSTAVMSVAAVVLMQYVHSPGPAPRAQMAAVLTDIKVGVRYVLASSQLRAIMILLLSVFLFVHTVTFLLPAIVTDVYQKESEAYGALVSMQGVGALMGAIVFAGLANFRRGKLLIYSCLLTSLALMALSLVPVYLVALAIMSVVGVGEAGRRIFSLALLMQQAEDRFRGRVVSIQVMMVGLMPLVTLPSGVAVDLLGAQVTVGLLAAAMLATALFVLFTQRSLLELQ